MDQNYLNYYRSQSGEGLKFEEEFGGLIRSPKLLQRGRGLGGVFANLFRYIKPLLYSGLKYFKDEALDAGSQFLSGKDPNEILKEKGLAAVEKLREKAADKIVKMTGSGRKRKRISKPKACKKRKSNKKTSKHAKNTIKRRTHSKKDHSRTPSKASQAIKDIFK